VITGELVSLRPVRRDDLPLLDAWENDVNANGEFNDFGLRPETGHESGFNDSGFLSENSLMFMVVDGTTGRTVGNVTARRIAYGPPATSGCYNIGISLVPEARGKGFGAEAQLLLAKYLFSAYPVNRVEASTDVTNVPEQRSLEKAGFTREGIARGAQWRRGEFHDMVVYSRVRSDG
jgi:aminoglycoside 6'-N-acetyltransferase